MGKVAARGRLKIFLGFAAGVGKTFRMLEEGQNLKRSGADVAIGYFEPHGRQDTIAKAETLEAVARRTISYRGHAFEEMDTAAILARRPAVCLVDELAHTNVPGSERAKRWEDVLKLLEAGIDVLTTLNVQHLESLNDQVFHMTGIRVRETVPDWVVAQADEVVMIDLTVEALMNRLRRGAVYPPEKAERALANFFRESTLGALRELALRQTAHQVQIQQEDSVASASAQRLPLPGSEQCHLTAREKVLVYVTSDAASAMLIRRAKRVADYIRAECFAVHVCLFPDLARLPVAEREALERHLNFARNLHIETRVIQGGDVAETLLAFSRRHQITQIFLGRRNRRRWTELLRPPLVFDVIRLGRDMRITAVAARRSRPH